LGLGRIEAWRGRGMDGKIMKASQFLVDKKIQPLSFCEQPVQSNLTVYRETNFHENVISFQTLNSHEQLTAKMNDSLTTTDAVNIK
jgi:hypothetical protein